MWTVESQVIPRAPTLLLLLLRLQTRHDESSKLEPLIPRVDDRSIANIT